MQIKEITNAIEKYAPLQLQESYDNSGIQVGDVEQDVKGVLLCIDITEAVINEAIVKNDNLIISHHPLLFHGMKKITPDDYIGRCVIKAIEHHIVLYASHTNMDKTFHGVSFQTAEKLGIETESTITEDGKIQNGEEEYSYGLGIIGHLKKSEDALSYLQRIKKILNIGCIKHTDIPNGREVQRIAICGGSGAEFIKSVNNERVDLYLTSDIKYHDYFFNSDHGMIIADIGHYESEQFTKEIFYNIISGLLSKNNVKFAVDYSDIQSNPIRYI